MKTKGVVSSTFLVCALVPVASCSSNPPATRCDSDGVCTTMLASYGGTDGCTCWSNSLAVDTNDVYWRECSGLAGTVKKVPVGGGDVTVLYGPQHGPCAVGVDATSVYFVFDPGDELLRAPLAGGDPTTLSSQAEYIASLAVDGTNVYLAVSDLAVGSIIEVPIDGGTATTLASGTPNQGFAGFGAVATDGTNVYMANQMQGGNVMSVPIAGGPPNLLATTQDYPYGVTVDATNVYWTTMGDPGASNGTVMSAPIAGGPPVTLASGLSSPDAIVVDGKTLYWSSGFGSDRSIKKMPVSGGPPTKIASCDRPGVAVDATSVYFWDGGNLMKLTPK